MTQSTNCIRCGASPAEWYMWQNGATMSLCMYHYKMTFNLEYKGIPWVLDAVHGPDHRPTVNVTPIDTMLASS